MRKYWYRRCLIIILVFTMAMGSGMLITEQQRKQEVSVESISNDLLIPVCLWESIWRRTV